MLLEIFYIALSYLKPLFEDKKRRQQTKKQWKLAGALRFVNELPLNMAF